MPGTKPSLRGAINDMCKQCICDPLDKGSWRQQVAACTARACPLHPVRPIDSKWTKLPLRLLRHWHINSEDLDERAKALIVDDSSAVMAEESDELMQGNG